MRRSLLSLISAVLAVVATAAAGTTPTPSETRPVSATTVFVSGRGWGHGVGMSQYGALGFANEGRGFAEILAHFYPGTTLGAAPVARVRVLLQEQRPAVTISSPVPFRVRDVFGKASQLPAGAYELGPALELPVNGVPTALAGPIIVLAGYAASPNRSARGRGGVPRAARRLGHRAAAERRQRRRARAVPRRRRAEGDAGRVASRGAQCAGGCGALVRARAPAHRQGLRPLR